MGTAVFTAHSTALELRNYLGMDQKAFAWALGVDQGTVSRWESGSTRSPKWLYLAVKGMRFTHSGAYECYCKQCSRCLSGGARRDWDRR